MTSNARERFRPRPRIVRRAAPSAGEVRTPTPATPASPVYRTQVIPFALIARAVQAGMWLACVLSFIVSWLGNIGMFGAALGDLAARPQTYSRATLGALAAAGAYQVVIQLGQFYTATVGGRRSRRYRALVLLSVVPSLWTYGVVVVPWAGSAVAWGTAWPIRVLVYGGSTIILFVILWLNDAYQEQVLVKKSGG